MACHCHRADRNCEKCLAERSLFNKTFETVSEWINEQSKSGNCDTMEFTLNENEEQKAREFRKKHKKCYVDTAIGGQFEYRFSPTGLGSVITIKCLFCKKKKDITDYDHW